MSEKLEFKKLREFGEIINDTFRFIKENFKPLVKTYIYFCGIFLLAGMIAAIIQQTGALKGITYTASNNPFDTMRYKYVTTSYVFVIFISLFSYTAINVSILSFIAIYIKKGNIAPTLEEVWGYFKYFFLRVFGSSIAIGAFIMVCFILCLVPGIYIFPAASLMLPIMIFENASLGYSFSHAFKLLKNQWWVTAASILVLWLITMATSSLASFPSMMMIMASAFAHGPKAISTTVIIISTVIQYVCQILMIIPIIGISLCYYNLSESQHSEGLMDRINKMGEHEDPFQQKAEY
ncbi:hypothetical protein [Pedobacter cryoconitis]|uniref:Glycerophosphoryl diester phosphodiesterase membrane domain-containing protein n=1 Tax=Pedobacter cryoconitis TaxID=188932 RepID=A0A7X0ML74_9SPHI|nr:hypothetical protein [Pedobacter cryoconitis]MBB6502801.1 hypothetical protein [Pedobacter cryoconitis]